jgi:hypothetical protein
VKGKFEQINVKKLNAEDTATINAHKNIIKNKLPDVFASKGRGALYKALGDMIDTISVPDLMTEIEVLVMVRQSNKVNTHALISDKQER